MKRIRYEDIGFDESIIDASEVSEFFIPIGLSKHGIYNLTFRSEFMYRGEAMSSYMILGGGLEDGLIFQSILFNGCKRYALSDLKFWLYNHKDDDFAELADSELPHIERTVTLSSSFDNCLKFWKDLKEISDQRFELFRDLSKKIGDCIWEIGQYNREVRKKKNSGNVLPRIIALVNMDDFFSDFVMKNVAYDEESWCLLRNITPYFSALTHAAKQGIYLVFTGNRDFINWMPGGLTKIVSQVINRICTRTSDTALLARANFDCVFDPEDARHLEFNEILLSVGKAVCGGCRYEEPLKITIPNCNYFETDRYISRIKETHRNGLFDKIQGCLFGGAAGDALGAPVEFLMDYHIFKKYGESGIRNFEFYETKKGKKALVTDDTQMTLFTAAGMIDALEKNNPSMSHEYIKCIYESYLSWLTTQEDFVLPLDVAPSWLLNFNELKSRRGPGNTCLSALRYGYMGSIEYKINNSKGCGSVMRVAPIGFLTATKYPLDMKNIGVLAADAAALTHGHELGYATSALLAMIIAYIIKGHTVCSAVSSANKDLLEILPKTESIDYLLALVDKAIDLALSNELDDLDAIRELGEGWVAEETLAIAIYCSVRYSDNFEKALVAAVNHSGDSDSTGAVTGNILGAYIGYEKIPAKFKENIDVEEAIESVVSKFSNFC